MLGKFPQIQCCIVEVFTRFSPYKRHERKLDTMHEHEHQENQRIAAKRAFTESLDQLQHILLQKGSTHLNLKACLILGNSNNSIDSKAWEDAAADLDQFFGDAQHGRRWT
jgi:hypothetical protein